MEFSRPEYWSGLPFSSPWDLPNPGIELTSLASPALAGGFFIRSTTWVVLWLSVHTANWFDEEIESVCVCVWESVCTGERQLRIVPSGANRIDCQITFHPFGSHCVSCIWLPHFLCRELHLIWCSLLWEYGGTERTLALDSETWAQIPLPNHLVVLFWENYLTSLSLCFIICKMGTLLTSEGCYENEKTVYMRQCLGHCRYLTNLRIAIGTMRNRNRSTGYYFCSFTLYLSKKIT